MVDANITLTLGSSRYEQLKADAVALAQIARYRTDHNRTGRVKAFYTFPRLPSINSQISAIPDDAFLAALEFSEVSTYVTSAVDQLRAGELYEDEISTETSLSTEIESFAAKNFPYDWDPLTAESLDGILQGLSTMTSPITVHNVERLAVLSAILVVDNDHNSPPSAEIFVQSGTIHPYFRLFLILHEIGHWHLHIQHRLNSDAPRYHYSNLFHEYSRQDREADVFALIGLIPTRHLLLRQGRMLRRITDRDIYLDFFKSKVPEAAGNSSRARKLRQSLTWYAKKRAEVFEKHYSRHIADTIWPRPFATLSELNCLKKIVFRDFAWGLAASNRLLLETNDLFRAMLHPDIRDRIINAPFTSSMCSESIPEAEEAFSDKTMSCRKATYYVRYIGPEGAKRAAVNAIPVVDARGQPVMSFGVVRPLQIPEAPVWQPPAKAVAIVRPPCREGAAMKKDAEMAPLERAGIVKGLASAYFVANRTSLRTDFGGHYVAVRIGTDGKSTIRSDYSFDTLLSMLLAEFGAAIEKDFVIQFIDKNELE